MENKPAIQFSPSKKFPRNNSNNIYSSTLSENSIEVEFNPVDFQNRKPSENKRTKSQTKSEEELKKMTLDVAYRFPISSHLINLLRNPALDHHKFDQQYLVQLKNALGLLKCQNDGNCLELALYIHLILAQVENLEEMEQLQIQATNIQPLNTKKWNSTNVMNSKCILMQMSNLPQKNQVEEVNEKYILRVQILKNLNCYMLDQGVIKISKNYVQLGLESNGHLDIYFAPFLMNKFVCEAHVWFTRFNNNETSMDNYALIYQQIAKQDQEYNNIDYEKWYQEQIDRIIRNQFIIEDLIPVLNYTRFNPWVQKLLIGLQGWNKYIDSAIKLLNVYYDNCDWQINSQFSSVIRVTGDSFEIDYLIDNPRSHQRTLVYCLHAPCLNTDVAMEMFSWHTPTLEEYVYEETSYIWAKMDFGVFPRSGFYNFAMFNLLDHGKEVVTKILDFSKKRSIEESISKNYDNTLMTMRSVKGRMIVQPPKTRDLSLHEVNIDSIAPEQGLYRASTFQDVGKQLDKYREEGINTVYLSSVFQRDNQLTSDVFRKPNASAFAFTHRTMACKMLGGDQGLKKLIEKAHGLNIKVIVDCSSRVSSSHMSKRYQGLRLKAVDEHGRIIFHYGANGKSISHDDTTSLNYRKKQSWDLLINESIQIVEKFKVDGFYLDNGFEWPTVYKINEEEMYRQEMEDNTSVYSNEQIFMGEVIIPTKIDGFWTSPLHVGYPNPLIMSYSKTLWERYPHLILISQALQIPEHDSRMISVIRSGPIPRSFKMPKALAQVMGVHLSSSGQISQSSTKHVINIKKWYEQTSKMLPNGAILLHSTTSPVWPYLSYIFKQATWAVIDLYLLMPYLTMTTGAQLKGKAYKSKSININYIPAQLDKVVPPLVKGFSRTQSSLMKQDFPKTKRGSVVQCSNSLLKDPSQMKYLQANLRKEVGPGYGFDLQQIHKHYAHRRQMRRQMKVLRQGKLMPITAQHIYGIHNNVLSFARYDQEQILLISINFNHDAIDMHYNLSPLKSLFKKYQRANTVLQLESILNPTKFNQEYYLISQLIRSKIDLHLEPYKTSIWKLTVQESTKENINKAIFCSSRRVLERLNRQPPAWIYSSVFFNQLNHLLQIAKTKSGIVTGLNQLYKECISPLNLNFSLLLSKNHEFYAKKQRLQKLFGVLQLVAKHNDLNPYLGNAIEGMISGNTLGPIAFVTPEIGSWSSVGGLGVMVDQLSKELARIGEEVYIITPYYQYNKKKQTNYLQRDGFHHQRNIKVKVAHFQYQFGIHRGKYGGVNYIWYHNPQLFSKPYDGQGASYVTKQLVYFALTTLESFCQLKIFPSVVVTNDWMCGFVSAYVKSGRFQQVFNGTKFMHICHNLDPLYQGRVYPKEEEGNLQWLTQLNPELYIEHINNKLVINPSKCALETCDNWGTVSNSYKIQLLQQSDLASILWRYPHPFSFPNGIRKEERLSILRTKTPGTHQQSKFQLQQKYFNCHQAKNVPLFSFIGRVTRQKGVHLILQAVQTLIHECNYQIQFLVGGMADSKQDYGKYCAEKMRLLHQKYPQCFWSNPDQFFSDGPLVNIGSDFAMMPSMFQPGGIVQHQFFCAGTPVITFCTGGLKDTVFEFDPKTQKGNGFNFLKYDLEDFKWCMRRALDCYKNKASYEKIRQNAAESVVEQEDVARGWNNQFYRLQNKIYIDKARVEKEIESIMKTGEEKLEASQDIKLFNFVQGEYWKPNWEIISIFRTVLQSASRLKGKNHTFVYETKKIPRPKEVYVMGSWDNWQIKTKLNFQKIYKNYKVSIKLKPDTYYYKYHVDGQWLLNQNEERQEDQQGIINHKVMIE